MATATLSQALRDLEVGKWSQIYCVVGEEPFQASEFSEKVRQHFIKDTDGGGFNYDVFDAEQTPAADLLASLDTLPGLFDAPDSVRLVVCRRFEKVPATTLELLDAYFKNPAPQTCFLILAEKVDRRKNWIKEVEKHGTVLEVAEPHDRDWPKWRSFFERRCGKAIEPPAWEALVDVSSRTLALVATECEKAALYIGEAPAVRLQDVREVSGTHVADDIFQLSEDVVARRSMAALLKLHRLLLAGESEIKILAILLRHFRQVATCVQLMDSGVRDPKVLAPQIGVPPFFVPKIQDLARGYNARTISTVMARLAACDFRLKTGEGSLWADFLVPHFQQAPAF
jgi:DNA polymerase-3 subunit delta